MNKAGGLQPKGQGDIKPPAVNNFQSHEAGAERKADMKGGLKGQPIDKVNIGGHGLGLAVAELKSQHPEKHSDHGPHHGGNSHIRHIPLHGMKPSKG